MIVKFGKIILPLSKVTYLCQNDYHRYVRKESSGWNHVYRVLEPVINKVHKTSCGGEELIESADLEVNTTILVW